MIISNSLKTMRLMETEIIDRVDITMKKVATTE